MFLIPISWSRANDEGRTCRRCGKQGGGSIINVTSIAGYMGLPFRGYYSATKGALGLITEALAYGNQEFWNYRSPIWPLGILPPILLLVAIMHLLTKVLPMKRYIKKLGPNERACGFWRRSHGSCQKSSCYNSN